MKESIKEKIRQIQELYEQQLMPEALYHEKLKEYLQELEQVAETASARVKSKASGREPLQWDYKDSTEQVIYPEVGMILRQRYLLQSKAGQGGMGIVYKALDQEASEAEEKPVYCAIKVLAPILQNDVHAINSLKREALRCKQLRHENIVQVYDFDSDNQWNWLKMEWLEGESLASLLAKKLDLSETGFKEQEILKLLPSLGEALDYAHKKGVIHRDIKPANIFQCTDGRLVILDFGIARIISNTLSRMSQQQAQASGTYEYMPPEAFIGGHKAHVRDDIYGLAVTLYELLSGERPYSGLNVTNRSPEIEQKLAKPHDLNDLRWGILKQALSCEAGQRPATMDKFIQAFLHSPGIVSKSKPKAEQKKSKAAKKAIPEKKVEKEVEKEVKQQESGSSGTKWLFAVLITGAIASMTFVVKKDATVNPIKADPVVIEKEIRPSRPDKIKESITGMELIKIPSGCFQMGSEQGKSNEKPVHKVCISKPYYLGKYEVTQGEWELIMGDNPSNFKKGANHPVENVSWDDVQDFIKKLNKKTGKNYRLPTEAEWEYACRSGGKEQTYCGGDKASTYAWYGKGYDKGHYPVGGKNPNDSGLYDMSGNVWEWVQDWYGEDYYKSSVETDPSGPSGGSGRGIRGGSWGNSAGGTRSADRDGDSPDVRSFDLGFRLARSF